MIINTKMRIGTRDFCLVLDSCGGSRRKLSIKTIILATGCHPKNPESRPRSIPPRRSAHHGDKDAELDGTRVLEEAQAVGVSDGKQPWYGRVGERRHLRWARQRPLKKTARRSEPYQMLFFINMFELFEVWGAITSTCLISMFTSLKRLQWSYSSVWICMLTRGKCAANKQ